jgi:hypothetical protein
MVANWTEKRLKRLKLLDKEGFSATVIAGKLGPSGISEGHSSPAPTGQPCRSCEGRADLRSSAGTADASGLARHPPVRSSGGPLPLAPRRRPTREAVLRCAVRWNDLLVRASPAHGFLRDLAAGCLRPVQGALGGRLRRIDRGRRIGAIGSGGISFTRAFHRRVAMTQCRVASPSSSGNSVASCSYNSSFAVSRLRRSSRSARSAALISSIVLLVPTSRQGRVGELSVGITQRVGDGPSWRPAGAS